MDKNILVYGNNTDIADKMKFICASEGIKIYKASDMDELLQINDYEDIHLLLIHLEVDEVYPENLIESIRYLRKRMTLPIIILSDCTVEKTEIMALNAGADDYVSESENPLVLLARIKSQLRRYMQLKECGNDINSVYRVGALEIDDRSHIVMVEGKIVKVTPIEYKILRLLAREQGKVFSINQIYENIWQMQAIGAENTIAVHIRHIREKIESNPNDPCYLKVVRGVGYKVG